MKKVIAILFAALMAFALCACGDSNTDTTEATGTETTAESPANNETYDTGKFSAVVPSGMYAYPVTDMQSEDGEIDDTQLIISSSSSAEEYYSEPYVQIFDHEEAVLIGTEEVMVLYDDAAEITPFTLEGVEWSGFTGYTSGYPITILYGTVSDTTFQVTLMGTSESEKLTYDDANVQLILQSITVTAK